MTRWLREHRFADEKGFFGRCYPLLLQIFINISFVAHDRFFAGQIAMYFFFALAMLFHRLLHNYPAFGITDEEEKKMKYCEAAETTCWEIGGAENYREGIKIEECGRILESCSEIVRDETGAIDFKHYHAKARDLRSEAIVTAPKNMIRLLAEVRQFISRLSGFSV